MAVNPGQGSLQAKSRGRGLGAWAKAHKGPAAAIGVASAGGIYLLYKHSAANAPGAGSSTSNGPANPATFTSSNPGNSSYGALEAQISRLQNQISRLARAQRKDRRQDRRPPPRRKPAPKRGPHPAPRNPPPTNRHRRGR